MKLVTKITLWVIGIVMLTTPICMYVSYNNIKDRISDAEIVRLQDVNQMIAEQLEQGIPATAYDRNSFLKIETLSGKTVSPNVRVVTSNGYNPSLHGKEYNIAVSNEYLIRNKVYRVTAHNQIATSKDITSGMLDVQLWKWATIFLALSITTSILSKYIFKPFRKSMQAIHQFNVKQKGKLQLGATSTSEFRELNEFLEKMADKAREDYAQMKQFSENASHELQTPLAVLRSKLELLTETDISEEQAFFIEDMQNAIDKLSRIHRTLTLLTKLENQEFETSQHISFCKTLDEIVTLYSDTLSMQGISITRDVEKDIRLKMHPVLAEMLITNLVSNAIRHNLEGGYIDIVATPHHFTISNSGLAPDVEPEELFQRFKKGSHSVNGTGLGLAIVKQICQVSDFTIQYYYLDGTHTVSVHFSKQAASGTSKERKTADRPAEAVTA